MRRAVRTALIAAEQVGMALVALILLGLSSNMAGALRCLMRTAGGVVPAPSHLLLWLDVRRPAVAGVVLVVFHVLPLSLLASRRTCGRPWLVLLVAAAVEIVLLSALVAFSSYSAVMPFTPMCCCDVPER